MNAELFNAEQTHPGQRDWPMRQCGSIRNKRPLVAVLEFKTMKTELFSEHETPFNLAGEAIDNAITPEGEARVRALAAREARKAQRLFAPFEGQQTHEVTEDSGL